MEMTVCQDGKVSGVEALGGEHRITTSRASQHQGAIDAMVSWL